MPRQRVARVPWVPVALVLLAVWTAFAAEGLAALDLGTQGAWEVVTYGIEAALLWLPWCVIMALVQADGTLARRAAVWLGRVASWWGMIEGLLRAGCRPAFSMHRPPPGGADLCDAATGLPISWISTGVAIALAIGVQVLAEAMRGDGDAAAR